MKRNPNNVKGNARNVRTARRDALVEALEGRTLMSSTPLTVTEVPFHGGTQLQVVGTAGTNEIAISQTAAGLAVSNGAGWAQTFAPNGGAFQQIVARAGTGNYSIVLDPSVTVDALLFAGSGSDTLAAGSGNDTLYSGTGTTTLKAGAGSDTLVALNGSRNTLVGGAGQTSFWVDARAGDTVVGLTAAESAGGAMHQVSSFLGTVAAGSANSATPGAPSGKMVKNKKAPVHHGTKPVRKAPKPPKGKKGAAAVPSAPPAAQSNLMTATPVNPKVTSGATGYTNYGMPSHPLFADGGPSADDIAQGDVGDCFFLATLASVAKIDPNLIRQSVVDLGDGTFAVEFHHNGTGVYVRVNADLPTTSWGSPAYADFGKQGAMWVAVMEKAYAFFRTGAGTYKSIDAGWMDEAYSALGSSGQSTYTVGSAQSLLSQIASQLAAGKSVTAAFSTAADGADVITAHAYTVIAVNADASGRAATVTVRNPWGVNDATGAGQGYVTLTAQQMFDSLLGYVSASV